MVFLYVLHLLGASVWQGSNEDMACRGARILSVLLHLGRDWIRVMENVPFIRKPADVPSFGEYAY